MTNEEYERLALDALFERRLRTRGCFVSNLAGEELIACPPDAVPVIEHILSNTVETAIAEGKADSGMFHGLPYVLGAYLVISAKSDPHRAVDFLGKASEALLVQALAALANFFRRMGTRYNCGVGPPRLFRALGQKAAASQCDEVRLAGERTLREVTWAS